MLYEYQTDLMLEKLHSGEIDVGILALPVAMDGLDSCELYKEPFTVALPAGHKLATRQAIKVDDLTHETLLLLEDGHCLRDQALEICSGADLHEKQDFRADQPRDVAADGRCGSRHHAAAGTRGARRLRQRARRHHQTLRQARADAHHRRGVASIHRAACRHSRAREADRGPRAVTPTPFDLRAKDGRSLAAHWFSATEARRGAAVINGATGFPQTFYFKLAQYLAERGYDALIYDYRGMNFSAPRDLAREAARMSDWGLLDMPAALDAAAERAQGLPVVTLGHSIGGQFLGLLRNHAKARIHVQIATSVGYWRWEAAPFRYLAWWFWRVHGPLMLALKGYVPSGGGWAGLPLPRGVYEEWRRWCLRPGHFGPDLATYLSGHMFDEIRAPGAHGGLHGRPHRHSPHGRSDQPILPERAA